MSQYGDALYQKEFEVRWADCDANQHMRHSAYADLCAHARVGFMNQIGMTAEWLKEQGLGPVLFKEQTEYFRELFMYIFYLLRRNTWAFSGIFIISSDKFFLIAS